MTNPDILADRRKKLEAIRQLGVNPFGRRFSDVTAAQSIHIAFDEKEGDTVRMAGRVTALRDHGKTVFADIVDRSGKIQVFLRKKDLADDFEIVKNLEVGDIIGVEGVVGKTRMGEVTVFAVKVELLCKSLRPLPEKWHGLKNVEIRYRRRFLDLVSNRESMEVFLKRSKIITELRKVLDSTGFLEVETPMMQAIPGGATAKPFITHHNALGLDLYMRIAPELFLKQLLVGGLERVYEIGRCFRNEGLSTRHNPEFTMLELYQAYGNCEDMMTLCEKLIESACGAVSDTTTLNWQGEEIDLSPPWPREKFTELIARETGINPWDEKAARELLESRDIEAPSEHAFVLEELFDEFVEKKLVQPTFVVEQPVELTPLCRPKPDDERVSDRFELFIAGMEFGNAYTELNDPDLQRKFFEQQLERKSEETVGKLDEDFLVALEHGMPPAGGMGIGVDRLVMLLTGMETIRDVVLFPLLRPRRDETDEDGE
ncbi:MAG: lysine--tRNA ligase [Planctomycetota bacterium]|nr:lysine--tRNA ligase [Planctomycetota bacterium]